MKIGYLSLIFYDLDRESLEKVNSFADSLAEHVEILCVMRKAPNFKIDFQNNLPITFLRISKDSSFNTMRYVALSSVIGDYVFEYLGDGVSLDKSWLSLIFEKSKVDSDLILFDSKSVEWLENRFSKSVETPSIGIIYSRSLINRIQIYRKLGTDIDQLIYSLEFSRTNCFLSDDVFSLPESKFVYVSKYFLKFLLNRVYRISRLFLLLFSLFVGLGSLIYASLAYIIKDKNPEGWLTLMVVIGLGQSILGFQLFRMQENLSLFQKKSIQLQ